MIINCLSKNLKEEIIKQNYDNPIEVKGKKVTIMKELPRQVIAQRRTFKSLTDKLRKKKMRFRWEIPSGINFIHNDSRFQIKSESHMEKFLQDNVKEFED